MTAMDFYLDEEPWLPVIRGDGQTDLCSLRTVLIEAHMIRELFDPSPLVIAALVRLLLVVLHRCFGPRSEDVWRALWQRGRFDEYVVSGYLDQCHPRFDLFAQVRPFYQVMFAPEMETLPIQVLVHDAATGNNATLWDHNFNDRPAPLLPDAAARMLVTTQAFALGGGNSKPFYLSDAALTRGFTVQIEGETLFQTLMLNLVIYNDHLPMPRTAGDLPAWEQDEVATPDKDGTSPAGYLDYLTFLSRRVHLIPDAEGTVSRCQVLQNLKLRESGRIDPFKAYLRDEKRGFRPLLLKADRALWRESHTLLEEQSPEAERPEIFNHLGKVARWQRTHAINARSGYSFSVYGMATEPAKSLIYLWRHERLPLPLAYLEEKRLRGRLREALTLAEGAGKVLSSVSWTLAANLLSPVAGGPQPDRAAVGRLSDSFRARLLYWPRLEAPFRRLMSELADDRKEDDEGDVHYGDTCIPEWIEVVRSTVQTAFKEIIGAAGFDLRSIRAVALAENEFGWRIHRVLGAHPAYVKEGQYDSAPAAD